jgi:hypothetical protein
MAAYHGKQGYVTFATSAVSNILAWSLDATCDTVESSVMSSVTVTSATHWKDHLPGYKTWTATVECDLDDGGLDPDLEVDGMDRDGVALVLYEGPAANSVRMYSGTAIITSVSPSLDKEGVATCTYTVQGSGTLTPAASDLA